MERCEAAPKRSGKGRPRVRPPPDRTGPGWGTHRVVDSAHSIVYRQPENRLHVQKAIFLALLSRAPFCRSPWRTSRHHRFICSHYRIHASRSASALARDARFRRGVSPASSRHGSCQEGGATTGNATGSANRENPLGPDKLSFKSSNFLQNSARFDVNVENWDLKVCFDSGILSCVPLFSYTFRLRT